MTEKEQIQAARNFSRDWSGHGDEMQETYNFWYALFRDVFGIEKPEKFFKFQEPVKFDGRTHNIDLLIPKTKVLIEQKSFGVDLTKKYPQSDGEILTPYEQAKRYAENLPPSMRPRWIIACNFSEFRIYNLDCIEYPDKYRQLYLMKHEMDINPPSVEDVENAVKQPTIIELENLQRDYKHLSFMTDENIEMILPDVQISTAAAKIVKKICDALENNYKQNSAQNYRENIYKICTRLVFCFYAGDANIFQPNQLFDYLNSFKENADKISALQKLFSVLNTAEDKREENLSENLKNFKYVNGGLFAENIDLPKYNKFVESPVSVLLAFNKNKKFSWHMISPPIFGAMFESTLNPETRREKGMHYTSVENIHKVINPLFLDRLHGIFKSIKHCRLEHRLTRLQDFQNKIASLKFLDPACGSGNFLTETFLSLRKLENEVLREMKKFAPLPNNPIKVSIQQFFGIEINDFAVAVAQTALWIAENQMLQETEKFLDHDLNSLPLKKYSNIFKANALQIDWNEVISNSEVDYIIGNPPFRGTKYQTPTQKADLFNLCENLKPLDYVTGWFKKADDFMHGTKIRCAFVSTNSIAQGEQVAPLWKILKSHIDFAHRSFKWQSDSDDPAAVYCVVIGFSVAVNRKKKFIFDGDKVIEAKNINGYLHDAPNIYIEKSKIPLQKNTPEMIYGSKPADGGNLILSAEEKNYFLEIYPESEKIIRRYMGGDELINSEKRFCLWLKDYSLDEIKKFPKIYERVQAVEKFRLASKKISTKKSAETPQLFQEIREPKNDYLILPVTAAGARKYIPIDFVSKNVIASATAQIIPEGNLFHFGILSSKVHIAWLKNFCNYLGTSFRYSSLLIYNTFVWCEPTLEQKNKIEQTARKILEVRKNYPNSTLAALYNEKTMPEDLRQAHLENDLAVMEAYGFDKNFSELQIVGELMKLYKNLTEKV